MKLWKVSNGRWYRNWEEGETKWEQAIFVMAECVGDAMKIARKKLKEHRKEYVDNCYEGKTPRHGKDDYFDVILGGLNNLKVEEVKGNCTDPLRI